MGKLSFCNIIVRVGFVQFFVVGLVCAQDSEWIQIEREALQQIGIGNVEKLKSLSNKEIQENSEMSSHKNGLFARQEAEYLSEKLGRTNAVGISMAEFKSKIRAWGKASGIYLAVGESHTFADWNRELAADLLRPFLEEKEKKKTPIRVCLEKGIDAAITLATPLGEAFYKGPRRTVTVQGVGLTATRFEACNVSKRTALVTYSGFHHQFLLHRSFEEFESRSLVTGARLPNTIEEQIKLQKAEHIVLVDLRVLELLGGRRWVATAPTLNWDSFYSQFSQSKAGIEWAKSKLEWDEKGFGSFVVNAADLTGARGDPEAKNPLPQDLLRRIWFVFTEPRSRVAPTVQTYPLFTHWFQRSGPESASKWFSRFTRIMPGKMVIAKPVAFYQTPTSPLQIVDYRPFGKISVESDFLLYSARLPSAPSFGIAVPAEAGPNGLESQCVQYSTAHGIQSVPCDFPFESFTLNR